MEIYFPDESSLSGMWRAWDVKVLVVCAIAMIIFRCWIAPWGV
jgi:hypothetical protein